MAINQERLLNAERDKAVAREFVTVETARAIATAAAENSRIQLAQQVTEKFVTIETARVIAKDEVERARATLAGQVEDARKALADLVQQQTRSEGSSSITTTRDEEARNAVAGLVKQRDRAAGSSEATRWFMPSGPALLSLVVAVIAVLVAVAALVLR